MFAVFLFILVDSRICVLTHDSRICVLTQHLPVFLLFTYTQRLQKKWLWTCRWGVGVGWKLLC